jgi:hypothetical protein
MICDALDFPLLDLKRPPAAPKPDPVSGDAKEVVPFDCDASNRLLDPEQQLDNYLFSTLSQDENTDRAAALNGMINSRNRMLRALAGGKVTGGCWIRRVMVNRFVCLLPNDSDFLIDPGRLPLARPSVRCALPL